MGSKISRKYLWVNSFSPSLFFRSPFLSQDSPRPSNRNRPTTETTKTPTSLERLDQRDQPWKPERFLVQGLDGLITEIVFRSFLYMFLYVFLCFYMFLFFFCVCLAIFFLDNWLQHMVFRCSFHVLRCQ